MISICLSITAEFYSKTQSKLQFELVPIHFAVWLISQRRKMIFLVNFSVVDERYLDSLFDQCKTGACHQCLKKIKAIKKVYTYIRFCPWLVLRKHTFHWFINQCRSSKRNKNVPHCGPYTTLFRMNAGIGQPCTRSLRGVCRFARLHPERYKILTKTFDFQFLGSCRRPHEVITP